MRILFISGELIGSALCQRFLREGHEVKLYIDNVTRKNCLEGIVQKTDDWKKELSWVGKDGLIVFDDVGYGDIQDGLRTQGYAVFGGTAESDKLELNRAHAQSILHKYKIKVLPSFNFKSVDAAIDFLQENGGKWVVKQTSHISVLNHVGEKDDCSDIIEVLKTYKQRRVRNVHLQKRAAGVEVGVARYFNGTEWVGPIEINHEHKRLNEGDTGPLTAEMGTVIWHTEDERNKLFKTVLEPITPHLQKICYKGDIDVNCIVTETDAWPLELTPRLGSPSTQLQCELYDSSIADFFAAIARGEQYDLNYRDHFGVVNAIATGPFPFPPEDDETDWLSREYPFQIDSAELDEKELESIHIEEISIHPDNENEMYWAGEFGYAAFVTASANTIPEAQAKVERLRNSITIPEIKYRTDIGDRVHNNDLPLLKKWGWI